jgi:hypothetical protein
MEALNNGDLAGMKDRCKEYKEALTHRFYNLNTCLSPCNNDSEEEKEIGSP